MTSTIFLGEELHETCGWVNWYRHACINACNQYFDCKLKAGITASSVPIAVLCANCKASLNAFWAACSGTVACQWNS